MGILLLSIIDALLALNTYQVTTAKNMVKMSSETKGYIPT
jgi:hypothetical protein